MGACQPVKQQKYNDNQQNIVQKQNKPNETMATSNQEKLDINPQKQNDQQKNKNQESQKPKQQKLNFKNQDQLEDNYDITKNEKLMEYYYRLKRGLDSKMKSALIAETEIFEFKTSNSVQVLLGLSEIIPEIGIIFKHIGLVLKEYQEQKLKCDLEKLANIYSNFENLPKILAKKITILKRNYIMNLNENFRGQDTPKRDYFSPKLLSYMKDKNLPEILAIQDLQIIEACCITMIQTNKLIPNKENHEIIVANKIVKFYKKMQNYNQISGQLKPQEQPEPFERIVGFIIPDDLFQNPQIPQFLKKGLKDKDDLQHKQRVRTYLKKLQQKQILEMLGVTNPNDPKHQPFQELLQQVNQEKSKCCQIF